MRILKEETSALIIDVQERLFPHMWEPEELERTLGILIRGLRVLEVPILVTQQYTQGLGATIQSIGEALGWPPAVTAGASDAAARESASPAKATPCLEKIAFSCCGEPDFLRSLKELGKKRILIAGIEAHVCVLQTTIDLLASGYTPVVIEDCISSRKENDKRGALRRLQAEGVLLSTCEAILFELTRAAGSDIFKAISRLVK